MAPWSTTTTPRPASGPGLGDRAGQRGQHRLAGRAEQVDAPVARAVGRVGRVEAADHLGLGLQRPDARPGPRGAAGRASAAASRRAVRGAMPTPSRPARTGGVPTAAGPVDDAPGPGGCGGFAAARAASTTLDGQPSGADFARRQTATGALVGPDHPRATTLGPDHAHRARRVGSRAGVRTRRHPPEREQLKTRPDPTPACPAQGSRTRWAGPPQGRSSHGSRDHAPAPRERRPLRAPDPSLEPEDEALHHDRAQRHLHHRPAAVAGLHRPVLRLHQGDRRQGRHDHVRGHQEAGPGGDRRAGDARRDALRQPALARRHAHQLPDRAPADQPPQGARRDRLRRRRRQRPHQEGAAADDAASATSSTSPSAASAR